MALNTIQKFQFHKSTTKHQFSLIETTRYSFQYALKVLDIVFQLIYMQFSTRHIEIQNQELSVHIENYIELFQSNKIDVLFFTYGIGTF